MNSLDLMILRLMIHLNY